MSILDRVQSVSTYKEPFKGLIYGRPGAGKTKLACEAPNPLLINCERGSRTLKNHAHLLDTKVFTPSNFDDVIRLFHELRAGNLPDVETVIIDTLTTFEKKRMLNTMKENASRLPGKNPYMPAGSDYQENGEAMKAMCLAFLELDLNLIIVAHDVEVQDETNTLRLRPALTPKVAEFCWGLVDFFVHLSMENTVDPVTNETTTVRKLQTAETRRVVAKSRYTFPSATIINPTFQDILDAQNNTAVVQTTSFEDIKQEIAETETAIDLASGLSDTSKGISLNLPTQTTESTN